MSLLPLIAICGTTGVGKSNLAIELAAHLSRDGGSYWKGARIINADAMQVYAGMDIITNKVPQAERQGIDHLLMGFKEPGEQYVVGQWVQDALEAIEETYRRRQIPIVVGGTSYWIQHLIFPNRLAYENTSKDVRSAPPVISEELAKSLKSLPPDLLDLFNNLPEHPPSAGTDPDEALRLHSLLSILDSTVATRWHWRDTRKVLRNLCIIKESGKRTSEILNEQSNDISTSKPRFRTLCFWLYAEPSILESRLNKRVDNMIEQGLLNEIRSLNEIAAIKTPGSAGASCDYTLGLYQSIGYKEFHEYLASPIPSEQAFRNAVERMKISTRQYAKRQISWIRNKLLPAAYAANIEETTTPAYLLDATELGDHWTSNVHKPAVRITDDFLGGNAIPDPFSLSSLARKMLSIEQKAIDPTSVLLARQKIVCTVCTVHKNRPFMVEEGREWQVHQKTRMHKNLAMKASKRSAYEEGDVRREKVSHSDYNASDFPSMSISPET